MLVTTSHRLGPCLLAIALVACGSDEDPMETASAGSSTASASAGPGSGGPGTGGPGSGSDSSAGSTGGGSEDDGGESSGESGGSADTGETGGDPPELPCSGVPTFEDDVTPSQEIHVAVGGADGDGCGSEASPCGSLDYATGIATGGTAIRIHAGTYPGGAWIGGLQGTEDAPIWIGGVAGEDPPVFDGGTVAFTLSGARYVIVHDIEIQNSEANGINADDERDYANPDAARFIVFRNLLIHDIGTGGNNDCLKLSGLDDFYVLDSDMSGCGGGLAGSGIDMVGCHDAIIAGNNFHDSPQSGNAVQTKGGSARVLIHGNRFDNAGSRLVNAGGSTDPQYYRPPLGGGENDEASNISVVSNLFIGGDAAVGFIGCVDCLAANNTIVDPGRGVFRILQESQNGQWTFTPARNGRVVNNIVYFSRSDLSTAVNVGAGAAPETFSFETNLWHAYDAPDQSNPAGELPSVETGGIYGSDPGFINPGGGDYGISADSPAAAAGSLVDGLTGDIRGACFAEPPSLGAWAVQG